MTPATESIKVVVHTTSGQLIKGSTQDFHPDRPMFRIVLPNGIETVPVKMAELKAVFFVKELDPVNPRRRVRDFSPDDANRANNRPVAVLFRDGELMVGYTNSFNPERQGVFLLPACADDNNLRVFVVKAAARTLKLGPAAEELARTVNAAQPNPDGRKAA
jgi:hypothetical protein